MATYDNIEQLPLHEFTRRAYLDYSMYVILDRALPNVADGLKPVQRRIVYAMSELGLSNLSKHKKSARTVGDVLGKYHPHSDMACYEAMVLMAQPFSYRYPLVDGQGNWGSVDDPKSFAAMRYTEARLSPYSQLLLAELGQGTVDWSPNFDGTLNEPKLLPAQVPNILLNGGSGIAVGMATDIPPHNLTELIDACLHSLKFPNCSVEKLCQFVNGPDYPGGAEIITPVADIQKMYEKGGGSIKLRATYKKENGEIIIDALPHQSSGAKVLEQIAAQMRAKKLPMVTDLRDESDHENPIRLVIVPRSNRVDLDGVMTHLFATTDLEKSYRVNLNMIGLDGKPKVKNLAQIISEWLTYRTETVRRRLQCRLDKVLERLHILDGLLIAYLNLDEVIAIIRHEDDPKAKLMERFNLTAHQADAILDLKLRNLAKLEEMKIRGEQNDLAAERDTLQEILDSEELLKKQVSEELKSIKKKFGDERRSAIVQRQEAQAIKDTDMMPVENVTVVLSKLGWVRCGKGHDLDGANLNYKAGDSCLCTVNGRSNQYVVFLDTAGRSYSLSAYKLPSARGQGEPLTGHFNPADGNTFSRMIMGKADQQYVVGFDDGFGFVVKLSDMYAKNKAGKALISKTKSSKLLAPLKTSYNEDELLILITKQGRILVYPITELPALSKGKGNKLIGIPKEQAASREDFVINWAIVKSNEKLLIYAGRKYKKLTVGDLDEYKGIRGRRGSRLPNGYRKVTKLEIDAPEQPIEIEAEAEEIKDAVQGALF